MWQPEMILKEIPMDPEKFIWFSKSKDPFGFLQNMAGGMPIDLGPFTVKDSETLYQLIRFSGQPEIQEGMLESKNGFRAKMVGKPHRQTKTIKDWDTLRFPTMLWCLALKVMQWPEILDALDTHQKGRTLVEKSTKDPMWGCLVRDGRLVGVNVLGQCWQYLLDNRESNLHLPPKCISHLTIQVEQDIFQVGELNPS